MLALRFCLAAALLLLAGGPAAAQPFAEPPADSLVVPFGSGSGVTVLLTNNGFGVGGLLRFRLDSGLSLTIEARVGSGRDEREEELFGVTGTSTVRFKRNYFVQLPLQIGAEQRLFAGAIDDSFRPFVAASVGPTLGWQWPYFRDVNGNGIRNDGEEQLGYLRGITDGEARGGLGGTLTVGAYLGTRGRSSPGVRVGYTATYYFAPVELLELDPAVEDPNRQFFGTPFVAFTLMRRF